MTTPRASEPPARWRRALATACVTMVAVLLTLAATLALDPAVGPAVLGIALTLSLSRSQLEKDARGRLEAGAALPVVGVATAGVGFLLTDQRWIGAAVFVVAMTGSVLLRLLGGAWRRIGALLALPFTALLVAPPVTATRFGPAGRVWVPLAVAVLAWASVTVVQLGARRLRLIAVPEMAERDAAEAASPGSRLRPPATVRLALQLAVSLSAAFVVGFLVFPERWAWIVLTALIVVLGNRGRADVAHKAIHRVLGSAAGTVLALLPIAGIAQAPALAIAIALIAVFVGTFARGFGYAWWALAATVALSIVQQLAGAPSLLLLQRGEEIVIGAVLGLLPAWVLLPVRSGGVVRLRIAGVLAALQDQLSAPGAESAAEVERARRELDRVSAPFVELTRVTRGRAGGAARWIALTEQCTDLGREGGSPSARRALGDARRAIREPAQLGPALERLRAELLTTE